MNDPVPRPRYIFPDMLPLRISFAQVRFEVLKTYAEDMERMLAKEALRLREHVNKQALLMEPDKVTRYVEDMAEDVYQLDEMFPRIFRNSLLPCAHLISSICSFQLPNTCV